MPTFGPTQGSSATGRRSAPPDCKGLLYVLAVVNVVTGVLHADTLESPARGKAKTGESKTRRM